MHDGNSYWRPESVSCNVPPLRDGKDLDERNTGSLGLGCQDCENRRIEVVLRKTPHKDELLHRVLVRDIAKATDKQEWSKSET